MIQASADEYEPRVDIRTRIAKMSSLEEVRLKPSKRDDFHPRANTLRQFRALFLKDLTLQWRSWKTNLCQLLTPIIFIVFAGLIQVIVNHMISNKGIAIPGTETPLPPMNPGRIISCSYSDDTPPYHPDSCTKEALNFFTEFPDWETYLPLLENVTSEMNVNITEIVFFLESLSEETCQKQLFDLPFFYIGGTNDSFLGNSTGTTKTGFIGDMVPNNGYFNFSLDFVPEYNSSLTDTCPVASEHSIVLPLFWKINQSDLNSLLAEVVQDYNSLANLSSTSQDQYGRTYYVTPLSESQYDGVMGYLQNGTRLQKIKPQAGIFLDKFEYPDPSSVDIQYSLAVDELVLYQIHLDKDEFKNVSGNDLGKIDLDVHRRSGLVNMMDNAILKHLMNQSDGGDAPYITTYIMPIPSFGSNQNLTVDIASIVGGILYPFAASFLIPVFMSSLVKDRFERQLIMMEQNGLSRWTYWLVTYTFNYILYIPVAIEIAIFSLIFQIRLFTQTNWVVLTLTFFIWGHAEVALGFFLSNFFSRPRMATIVGYMLVIIGVVVSLVIEAYQIFPPDATPFFAYMLWPPFAFYTILMYFINACLSLRCYGVDILDPVDGLNIVTRALLYLAGSAVLLMMFSVYLSYVLPTEYGVRRSPFFPIIDTYKWLKSRCGGGRDRNRRRSRELERSPTVTGIEVEGEDEDVDIDVQEEENSIRDQFPDSAPMVMYQLRKEYPGGKGGAYVAVDSMSLAIDRNECFGLLGPNGAGKTTLISVLTGLYEPTSGVARIAGYDLATEISDIHHHLGVCPQFDIQHADLTTEEHLLFYARLKGVKWSREKVIVERALRQVNLYDARKKKSRNLSGGMRRRLSVAMACIGNPDILILDEPTTGLDPASRQQVWEVVQSVKEGRSVILTTHAMEEADHLCTRIGIMNYGKLRCLGTQTHLKAKFGTGYLITFNCAPGQVREVEGFVLENLPNAIHVETYSDSCTFKMEKEHLKVSEVFPLINGEKVRLGILDWGVKMTTLEDVFLKIVQRHSDHRSHADHSFLPAWLPCRQ